MNRLVSTRLHWMAAAVMASALVFAACGGDGDNGSNAGEADTREQARTAMTVSIGAEPASMDPLLKSDGQRDVWGNSVFEALTRREGKDLVPLLATEWNVEGNTWTFKVREGVTFHNGQPLTAKDVEASWKRMLSEDSEHLGSKVLEDTEIEAVDDHTVTITRPVPDPTTPARAALVQIVPAEYAALDDKRLSEEAISTGPYKMDAWNRGQNIQLSAFDGYWGDKPQIKKVTLRFDEEVAVRQAALEAGEIQMALNMSPELANEKFKREDTPVSEVAIMRLNSQFGPFTDQKVRRAANLAINRQALIDQIYSGAAGPAGGQEIAEYVFGFNDSLEPYEYDPEEAKRLLTEAGAEGAKVEIWGTRGHWTNDAQLSEAVTGMLNDVGFKVDLKQPPFADWVEKVFVAEKNDKASPDIMIYNHSNELFDASLTIGQNLTCKGASSTTCIKEVDEIAQQALQETDEAQRQELYDQAWQILKDQDAFVSIAEVYKVTFLDKGLEWEPEVDGFVRFQNMSFAT